MSPVKFQQPESLLSAPRGLPRPPAPLLVVPDAFLSWFLFILYWYVWFPVFRLSQGRERLVGKPSVLAWMALLKDGDPISRSHLEGL